MPGTVKLTDCLVRLVNQIQCVLTKLFSLLIETDVSTNAIEELCIEFIFDAFYGFRKGAGGYIEFRSGYVQIVFVSNNQKFL